MHSLQTRHNDESELARIVKERIKWDKRVSAADLNIVVRGAVVIVSGLVDTSFKKNAALEVISETEGVWSIDDRITVPGEYFRADEDIKSLLEEQIDEQVKLGGEHIEVEVMDGIVKLEGEVFRPRMKAMAVAAAWELSGVRDVLNFIEIKHPPQQAPLYDDEYVGLFSPKEESAGVQTETKEVS